MITVVLFFIVFDLSEKTLSGHDGHLSLNGSYEYFVPHIPPSESGWNFQCLMVNGGKTAGSIRVDVFEKKEGAYSLIESHSFSMEPFKPLELDLTNFGGTGQRWIGIDTDEPINGQFSFSINRGEGVEKANLSLVQEEDAKDVLVFQHIPEDRQQFWSGFCLLNINESSCHVQFDLIGTSGNNLNRLLTSEYQSGITLSGFEKRISRFEGVLFDDSDSSEKVSWIQVRGQSELIGFELFGKQLPHSRGQLAGLLAFPPHGAAERRLIPLDVAEGSWLGISMVNTSGQDGKVNIIFREVGGQVVREEAFSLLARRKLKAVINDAGFELLDHKGQVLLDLGRLEVTSFASLQVSSPFNMDFFALKGTEDWALDGFHSHTPGPSTGVVIPSGGDFSRLNIVNCSESVDLISVNLIDENRNSIFSNQFHMEPYASRVVQVPSPAASVAIAVVSGTGASSSLQCFADLLNFSQGGVYSVIGANAMDAAFSTVEFEVGLEVSNNVDTSSWRIMTSSFDVPVQGDKATIPIGKARADLLIVTDETGRIQNLGFPLVEVRAGLKSDNSYVLDMTSLALVLGLSMPTVGNFTHLDFFSELASIMAATDEFKALCLYLKSRANNGVAVLNRNDLTMAQLILRLQNQTMVDYQLAYPWENPISLNQPSFNDNILLTGHSFSEFSGIEPALVGSLGGNLFLSLTNHYYRHGVVHVVKDLDSGINSSSFICLVPPANIPMNPGELPGQGDIEWGEGLRPETVGIEAPINGQKNYLVTVGVGRINKLLSEVNPDLRKLYFSDLCLSYIGPVVSFLNHGDYPARLLQEHVFNGECEVFASLFEDEVAFDEHFEFERIQNSEALFKYFMSKKRATDPTYLSKHIRFASGRHLNLPPTQFEVAGNELAQYLQTLFFHPYYWMASKNLLRLERYLDSSQVGAYELSNTSNGLPWVVDFRASPPLIAGGGLCEITWNVLNANQVTLQLNSDEAQVVDLSGSLHLHLTDTTDIHLVSTNDAGQVDRTLQVTVLNPIPEPEILSFKVDPPLLFSGEKCRVFWDCSHTDQVTFDGLDGTFPGVGEMEFWPAETMTLTLQAHGTMGIKEEMRDIHVYQLDPSGLVWEQSPFVGNLRLALGRTFIQGSPEDEPCRNPTEAQFEHVLNRSLLVMETEVTRQMWSELRTTQPKLPIDPTHSFPSPPLSRPVDSVSWRHAIAFANHLSWAEGLEPCYYLDEAFLTPISGLNFQYGPCYWDFNANGYRLPTEAEWEMVARAGTQLVFSFYSAQYNEENCSSSYCSDGVLPQLEAVAWFCSNSDEPDGRRASHIPGALQPNPWGIYDLHGNMSEWCWDWYTFEYPSGKATDYPGPNSGEFRIARGGNWFSFPANLRCATRGAGKPDSRSKYIGFRLVRNAF